MGGSGCHALRFSGEPAAYDVLHGIASGRCAFRGHVTALANATHTQTT